MESASKVSHSYSHSAMDGGHADHGTQEMCSMNMLFTWNYKNTCVVFKWWHIRNVWHLLVSMAAIAILAYLYEYLKYYSTKSVAPHSTNAGRTMKLKKAVWYGASVGFSFMLMLVFMTYNGWLMLAVVFGAAWGHYAWAGLSESSARTLACH
ncbi:LADA_0F01574g1_1 [Lachancea dasiensis]|uniref:Copper transport protein n=1 Tax=Lachancea dasiensis TaxID=1072105 RepID=A0A1G4JI28_9SACH|nr:LADA_0F01574g1_1 [Lachancea dasiensis]